MAVYMGLVEPEYRAAVIENIVKDIRVGTTALPRAYWLPLFVMRIAHAGRDDVIFDMNSRTDVPGYGYQLAREQPR
jgi:hypothetical protein